MFRGASAVALAAFLLAPPQDPPAIDPVSFSWSGIDGWGLLLQRHGVLLHGARLPEGVMPIDTWVILFGEAPTRPEYVRTIESLIGAGAQVLIASDRPSMAPWFRKLGVSFVPGPIKSAFPLQAFKGEQDCPIVEQMEAAHPLFRGVKRIAFNRPGGFTLGPPGMIALLPSDPSGRDYGCIWEGLFGRRSSSILISDHSVFINLMLMEEGNGLFATNLIRHFRSREALFFMDGWPIEPGAFGPEVPEPDAATILANMGPAIRAIETSGMIQNFAANNAIYSFGFLTMVLISMAIIALMRARSRPVVALAGSGAILSDFAFGVGRATPDRGNYRMAAQELLRQWWMKWKRERDLPSVEYFEEGRFTFEAGTPALKRWIWRIQLRRLAAWTRRPPRRLSLKSYRRLAARLETNQALGRIR
jgi:hypothetical protein